MPKSKVGVLLKTDIATNIFLKQLAGQERRYGDFLIMEIDDRHLFVEENKLEWIRDKVQKFKDDYNWRKPNDAPEALAEQHQQ